jgi:hypothetical protein
MLAKTYHLLPSEVLARATTFDLMVADAMMTWEQEQQDRANGKQPTPQLSQEQMRAMLERVRNKQDGR